MNYLVERLIENLDNKWIVTFMSESNFEFDEDRKIN